MTQHTTNESTDEILTFCACGCGTPLPKPKFPSRQRRYLVGHSVRSRIYFSRSLSERFWSKVNKRGPDECWEWQAYRDKDGYGHIRADDPKHSDTPAHRVSYELTNGSIPDGLFVCHRCDNPACVNPAHLFLGTHQDNVDDMIAKGRKIVARGESQHCSKLTAEQVTEIRRRYASGNITMYTLAVEWGMSVPTICNIIHRKTWKHIP